MKPFSEKPITVTMTGMQWFALAAALCYGRQSLTNSGKTVLIDAEKTLTKALAKAAADNS